MFLCGSHCDVFKYRVAAHLASGYNSKFLYRTTNNIHPEPVEGSLSKGACEGSLPEGKP
jgi:hypothetical protein